MEINIWSIENSYYEETKLFPTTFLNQCRNNPNEPQNIPNEIKADLFLMAMEQGLYVQVVMIRQRESDDKSKNKRPRNIISKENQQDQDVGLHLIMGG